MRRISSTLLSTALLATAITTTVTTAVGSSTVSALDGGSGAVALSALDAATVQTFDTLAISGTANALTVEGWYLSEAGTSARNNGQYAADTGSGNTGDTIAYGAAGSAERAFGGLQSGTLNPTVGAQLANATGAPLTGIDVAYAAEQWRLGALGRPDGFDVQISTDATSLTNGTWTDVDALDVTAPVTAGTVGVLDGNLNRTLVTATIDGLAVAPGASVWIRWLDRNATGADDGFAIDDVSFTPRSDQSVQMISVGDASIAEGSAGTTELVFTVSLRAPAGPGGVTFDVATADGTATAPADHAALSLTGQIIPEGATVATFPVAVVGDPVTEPDEDLALVLSNVAGARVLDGRGTGTILNDDDADAAPDVQSTVPANGATDFPIDGNLSVTFTEPVDVADPWFTLECSITGTVAATFAGGPTTYTIDPSVTLVDDETCTLTVLAGQVTDQDGNDPPDAIVVSYTTGFTAFDVCLAPFTPIPSIQGAGAAAAITGAVTTQGVVVGDFEGTAANSGFFLQDPVGDGDPATSDGIFVFTGNTNRVSVGQVVRVTGFARERFNQTAINGTNSNTAVVTDIVGCGNGSVAPTEVTLPFATTTVPEQYEGMLVTFPQPLVIAEYFNYDRFGEIVLAQPAAGQVRPFTPTAVVEPGDPARAAAELNARSRITLDDNQSAQNPATLRHPNGQPFSLTNRFRGGDLVAGTTGVLGFDFSLYRVFPTQGATYTAVNPRPPAPDEVGGSIRTAAMNTLNFFVTADYPTGNALDNKCGPLNNVECRGWDSDQPDEFPRQRTKLLAALAGLDADIIGLNELENSTGVEPLESIVAGLPGYDYVATGTIGTDAIKVGLIYRSAVVTPVGPYQLLTTAVDPRFLDTKSRPALAQTFEVNATGARFTVVVNHFKSKGSDCLDVGDPDLGDGQGNCNVTRRNAALALVDWLATDPTGSGDPDVLIMGDLNSYAKEDPIDAILAGSDDAAGTADDYTNLIAAYQGEFAYSYTFDGQAGYLDHALGNASISSQVTGAADWHINSDEPDVFDYDTSFKPAAQDALYEPNEIRSSDHDPVVVGLDPAHLAPTAEAGGPYAVVEGATVTLTAAGADPEARAVTFDWDLDGDGTFETPGQSVPFAPTAAAPSTVTVTVRVTDAGGLTTTDTATVRVQYPFTGFFAPVDNPPVVNEVQAGRGVPVRFSLDGFRGLGILDGAPQLVLGTCTGGTIDRVELTVDVNRSFLLYNPFADEYVYVWRTDRAWRRECGELRVRLADGTVHTALFRFR